MDNFLENKTHSKEPESINPPITLDFIHFIERKAREGVYRIGMKIGERTVPVDIFPEVFPPESDQSVSSKSIFETFGDLSGLEIADIGSGSGIQSIVAVMAGARHVDAADISPQAVECSKHNVEMNGLQEKIEVFYSDLLKNFPKKKYDLIIANLPIVNFDAGDNPINNALYDKGLAIHKRLFVEAKEFLAQDGQITFTHANLQSAKTSDSLYDFKTLEKLIDECGYEIVEQAETIHLDYTWINYKVRVKK